MADEQALIMLRGDLVELGPLRRDMLDTYLRWTNDLDVVRTLALPNMPMTREMEENWINHALTNPNDAVFTIYARETEKPIGNAGLHDIDLRHGTANFGIMIGDKDAWNKGYGTETTRMLLSYGFDALGLQNIMLETYSTNPGAVRAYEKAGFKLIGVRRSAVLIGRTRADAIFMDATPEDIPPSDLQNLLVDGPPRR